jgi:hypothetical protein
MESKREEIDAFVQTLQKRLDAVRETKPRSVAKLLEDKEQLLVRLTTRLDATVAARKQAIEDYDQQIRRRKSAIKALEEEIRQEEARSSSETNRPKVRN